MVIWEYFTTFVEADTESSPVPVRDDIPLADHPRHTPYSLMPQLNRLGAQGWELVSIQPLIVGKKHDVRSPDADSMKWGSTYFCTFKRPVG